jgi:lantibiotic modifying enzyme
MGLALLEAGAALSDADLIEAGARAFAWERTVFVAKAGNWPDFRYLSETPMDGPVFMVAWCHGAAGIGLARLRAMELLPGHPHAGAWREDLEIAMQTTADSPLGNSDHLCCGTLGRAAVLHIAGKSTGNSTWISAADTITRRVAARARSRGRFTLPYDDPGTTGPSIPNLMNGLAGIGVHMACMEAGEDLSSLLL